jgi:hypothetical protein
LGDAFWQKGAVMERLTRRSANGTGVYATPSGEPVKWENNRHNVLQKLADYEDLEEQGRLVKLPCKIGDDVYYVPSKVNYKLNILNRHSENNKVYHQKVEDFVLTRHGWYLECDQDVKYGTGHILTDVSFCKTWFLTKSEAEAKLKELRGGENESNN